MIEGCYPIQFDCRFGRIHLVSAVRKRSRKIKRTLEKHGDSKSITQFAAATSMQILTAQQEHHRSERPHKLRRTPVLRQSHSGRASLAGGIGATKVRAPNKRDTSCDRQRKHLIKLKPKSCAALRRPTDSP